MFPSAYLFFDFLDREKCFLLFYKIWQGLVEAQAQACYNKHRIPMFIAMLIWQNSFLAFAVISSE